MQHYANVRGVSYDVYKLTSKFNSQMSIKSTNSEFLDNCSKVPSMTLLKISDDRILSNRCRRNSFFNLLSHFLGWGLCLDLVTGIALVAN